MCKNYIETKPRETFIIEEIERINIRIILANGQRHNWNQLPINKDKTNKQFRDEMGITKIKKQLKNIKIYFK
jgi:hypothetical protein